MLLAANCDIAKGERRTQRGWSRCAPAAETGSPVRFVVWDRPIESAKLLTELERRLVDQNIASWNHMSSWLRQIEALQGAA